MSIQSYDIQIPAGGAQTLEAGGQIFDFLSSGSAFDQIQVLPEFQQGNVTLKLGQGFDAGKVVNRWFVKNPGTTAINGTVVLSTAGFRNFRITGDVNVLDGGKSRTLAQAAFCGNGVQAAVAAQFSRVQLWNPAGSGVRAVVESLSIHVPAGLTAAAYFATAQLATLEEAGQSKLANGAAAKCSIYMDTTAVAPTFPLLTQVAAQANSTTPFQPKEPFIVPPGYGLELWSSTLNAMLGVNFEWYEEANT
ncbi:TPA: hypothetical protein QDB26_004169 [Burkholderia vietnamiensis]|uniref:hypothetical protein n=1 Tax=Burkholderia vietnamiensis TaxID=60552 RepID=UPI001593B0DA|nr:hypothetical protein [Burkholderia vietnamiensis]UKV73153.1 hypothetical protein FOC29_04970 [Burkholderia vietnamiensis]HDR8925162.1 hypothetical protein [Burkholderia vietnamiensis]HDR9098381.1 hypothetical protein [Burkholderia vietnamiensis]HDR9215396.1 hypothetical protein [Burkholderia vietnamiensis]